MKNKEWFKEARYGLFIHYGLYSLLERGEWVLNREHIPVEEYKKLASQFMADQLDFDVLLGRAKNDWGMRYVVLTTMHHEGFRLYDTDLSDFCTTKTAAKCGLRVGLYHELTNRFDGGVGAKRPLNR
jgi:alpha-L-fucosidase